MAEADAGTEKKGGKRAEQAVKQIEAQPAREIKPLPGTRVTYDLEKADKKKVEK